MPLKTTLYLKSASMRWPRKQKRRELLSVNMISLPLGDFRHLSHIGLDAHGDVFGDLATFQRTGSLILHSSQSHQDLYSNITPNETPPPPPKPPRLLSPEEMDAQASKARTHPQASRHQRCLFLPLLDVVEVVSHDSLHHEEEVKQEQEKKEEGGLTMGPDGSELNTAPQQAPCPPVEAHPGVDEDSYFVLNLDLGPSILEDVLQVMNQLHQ
ncbi:cdc42 effector protein 3 [Oncorhynchus kisutch]|uniref:Cdc42 effector protein 3 n=1 Tax=Oncorhynchus kisutch TaxID=8019 RepID=A0A8C7I500_ONCKI|nr:cdc42 effector protein 3 [Oncorhynchus kisutch]XP_020351554.1 cdc42 effector protein 3 [Oncorhynchus kisutch]